MARRLAVVVELSVGADGLLAFSTAPEDLPPLLSRVVSGMLARLTPLPSDELREWSDDVGVASPPPPPPMVMPGVALAAAVHGAALAEALAEVPAAVAAVEAAATRGAAAMRAVAAELSERFASAFALPAADAPAEAPSLDIVLGDADADEAKEARRAGVGHADASFSNLRARMGARATRRRADELSALADAIAALPARVGVGGPLVLELVPVRDALQRRVVDARSALLDGWAETALRVAGAVDDRFNALLSRDDQGGKRGGDRRATNVRA